MSLDEVDSKILQILMNNSRESISRIAKRLGLSRPTVRKRIKRLVDSGIIKGFSVLVDENLIKGVNVLCTFRTQDSEGLVKELKSMDEVTDIYLTTGERNVVCIARVPDLKTLEDLVKKLSDFNVSFEASIVLHMERKPAPPMLIQAIRMSCDYCGREIVGKPLTYTLRNRKYYLCCPTCFREFSRKMRLAQSR